MEKFVEVNGYKNWVKIVNTLSDLPGFFDLVFECKLPLIERFPFGGQFGILRFPCLCRKGGLAVQRFFEVAALLSFQVECVSVS